MEEKNLICIVCPNGCHLNIKKINNDFVVTGNSCKRGREFAINELISPKRSICSSVKTTNKNTPRISVRTDGEVSFNQIIDVMKEISKIKINYSVNVGDIIIENVLNSGINIIATSEVTY